MKASQLYEIEVLLLGYIGPCVSHCIVTKIRMFDSSGAGTIEAFWTPPDGHEEPLEGNSLFYFTDECDCPADSFLGLPCGGHARGMCLVSAP